MKLAVIIPSQGNAESALGCLASLAAEVDSQVTAIVVDNASCGDAAQQIELAISARGWKKWARLVRANVDCGFAAAHNLGIRSEHASAYLLLDPETRFEPGAVAALRAALGRWHDAGIVGPCLLDDGAIRAGRSLRALAPASVLFRLPPSTRTDAPAEPPRKHFDALLPAPQQAIETDWPARASVLIRRGVIDKVGLLDEGYAMFFEDVAYCRKVRAAGWRIMYFPNLDVTQAAGRSAWLVKGLSQLGRCVAWAQTRAGNFPLRPTNQRQQSHLQRSAAAVPPAPPAHLDIDAPRPPSPIFHDASSHLPFLGAMRLQSFWRAGESN